MVTGLVGAQKSNGTGFDYAGAVLDNVSHRKALCLDWTISDATEKVAVGVDAGATLICGWIGAAFVASSARPPTRWSW